MDPADDLHYARLADLLDLERKEEVARLAEARKGTDREREERGETIARLEVVEEEAGLAGRWLATFQKASREQLPHGVLDVGDPVALGGGEGQGELSPGGRGKEAEGSRRSGASADKGGTRPPQGVVARRNSEKIVVAFDDELPEWAADGKVRLDRLPDDVTHRKLKAALARVRAAKKPERLFELREAIDGRREVAAAKPVSVQDDALNETQRAAVAFALGSPDVALIHGPPGTGKTTAVVALIAAAVARGERVLACAASNGAVDLLTERLVARGIAAVRCGHPARISPAVLEASLDARVRAHDDAKIARDLLDRSHEIRRKLGKRTRAAPDWAERRALRDEAKVLRDDARRLARVAVDKVLDGAPVVCATLTGAEGEPLRDRVFDLVVIDEAAQALEPASWIAIARARRVVLAGDHRQLPPTVLSPEAARRGLARTLFARLHERAGESIARMLTVQYRMHEAIAAFPSARFYEGRLVAAEANRRHLLAELPGAELVDPWTAEPLLLYDTAGAGFEEQRAGEESIARGASPSLRNEGEAGIAAKVAREIVAAGVAARDVGVIAPYSAQVAVLRALLRDLVAAGLDVSTADGFQGREREAIVLSLVRSNEDGEIGFLGDHRRANVSLTRARRALVIVGDGATLGGDPFFAALWERCEKGGVLRSAYELM